MKRKLRVYKFRFRSPLHVGTEGPWNEDVSSFIHSDTLMGALYALSVTVKPDFCEKLKNGDVRISSAFPFSENSYFLPRPIIELEKIFDIPTCEHVTWKKLKKLEFIPIDWLQKILKGNKISVSVHEIDRVRAEIKGIFKTSVTPKVTLDRITQNSNLYHYGKLHFGEGGLFILAKFKDGSVQKDFEGLLKLLGDEGIGGRRTAGYGLFDVERDEIEIDVPENSGSFFLLSLYWPPKDERKDNLLKNSSYRLVRRTGWFLLDDGRSFRKRPVWMFQEGSVLSIEPNGGAVDVTPKAVTDKRVYRFGFALSLPFGGQNADLQVQKD